MNVLLFFLIVWCQERYFLQNVLARRHVSHFKNRKNHMRDVFVNEDDKTRIRHDSSVYKNLEDGTDAAIYSTFNDSDGVGDNVDSQLKPIGSFPSLIDVAPIASVFANATCGTTSSDADETFCKLGGSSQCSVCSGLVADKKHLIEYTVDTDPTNWWQSPTLEQGPEYEYVTVTLDLRQEYYVWYVIIKCANSPRPANWILERSIDGTHFSVWQYFVANEDDCWQYGVAATANSAANVSPTDNETLCSTFYSKIRPLEGGEIHAFIAKGRPGCAFNCTILNTKELREFSRARFVRFRFQKFNVPKEKYNSLTDASFQRKLFYSIKKISIGTQCICNGHATKCKRSHESVHPQCECLHNTCGSNCERCCSLFNQKIWKEGTTSNVLVCEQCQCHGHAVACRYDAEVDAKNASVNIRGVYRGGGVCINCTKHTTGVNCEKCVTGWYRPSGVPADAQEPCIRCDCGVGSTGHCLPDDSSFLEMGKKAGSCTCLEGFDGFKCDRCAIGYFNYPYCEKCGCDSRGTKAEQSCEQRCKCKANVEGGLCDKCKKGYFDLSASNPFGCTECFCSGKSSICREAEGYKVHVLRSSVGWIVRDANLSSSATPVWDPEANVTIVSEDELKLDSPNYYWSAPDEFLGNKISSYGLALRVSVEWLVMRGDTSGKPNFNPDVVIIGRNGNAIAHGNRNYPDIKKMMLSVRLSDKDWYRLDNDWKSTEYFYEPLNDSKPANRHDILSILTDIAYILLRAKFHTDQVGCSLVDFELETGIEGEPNDSNSSSIRGLESCNCPAGYTGLSCEKCDYGYAWLETAESPEQFICTLCDCNGHSPTCDKITGRCETCEHNTTGAKCEFCQKGFYGNAKNGLPTDCERCACPLTESSNNFSPTCVLEGTAESNDYVCDRCPVGYTGTHCEICDDGFYGNPFELGSKCVPCDCAGNPCNRTTGQCLKCDGNTEGWYCEVCKEGFFGSPNQKNCSKCECDEFGSENGTYRDPHTGQCSCKIDYIGRKCDRCREGYGDIAAGCTPCNCNLIGSESEICDSITGQCRCKIGITGRYCDRCFENYYGFESGLGCQKCNCNITGSFDERCDDLAGQCECKENAVGRMCDQCKDGYWNLGENGCVRCDCDEIGSVSPICHFVTGQCVCKYDITGRKCDRCRPNYYGFSKFGCFECEKCDKRGHVCNEQSGRCSCPYLTEGAECERCASGAWNYKPNEGCQECNCHKHGCKNTRCDTVSGQCDCRVGYSGQKCDICASGYYGFPKCRPCSCNLAGSNPETCTGDQCLCDGSGQCYCKTNTAGRKCDQCVAGTFGLHPENVGGCTSCFCFGRSTQCSEAGLTWSHVKLRPDRLLTVRYDIGNSTVNFTSVDNLPVDTQEICFINWAPPNKMEDGNLNVGNGGNVMRLNVTNNLRLIPGQVGDIEIGVNYLFDGPVYWKLPEPFLGDKVLSYGGYIEFTVDSEGDKTWLPAAVIATYPLIQMQGNNRFVLEYFPPSITLEKTHRVRLHESLWKLKNNPTGHVSREIFMLTLQNLQHILIRATKSIDFTKAILSDVVMDTAVRNEELLPFTTSLTHGIEMCDCPSQYSSSSCQNPNVGYYRHFSNRTTTTTAPGATVIIEYVGEAIPCNCNGLSTVCDINTGVCKNCSKNTGGDHCERCARGFYKDEFSVECKPCPCPFEYNNHAAHCYVPSSGNSADKVRCYCAEGYKGELCDKCEYGWFGYPNTANGTCQRCDCHPVGSASDECHEETGECNCHAYSTGRHCSECKERNHVLTAAGCTPCNDNCVQMLLDDVAAMSANLSLQTDVVTYTKLKPPWHLLNGVEDEYSRTKSAYDAFAASNQQVVARGNAVEQELRKKFKSINNKMKKLGKQVQNLIMSAQNVLNDSNTFVNVAQMLRTKVQAVVTDLEKYTRSERTDLNLPAIVNEARRLLNEIEEWQIINQRPRNEEVLRWCRHIIFENVRNYEINGLGLHSFGPKVQRLQDRVDNLNSIVARTDLTITEARRLSNIVNNRLLWITNKTQETKDITVDVNNDHDELQRRNDFSKLSIEELEKNLQNIRSQLNNLRDLIRTVTERETISVEQNIRHLETYIRPAEKYADELYSNAQLYIKLFKATKHDADIALKASNAYKNIVDALLDAKQAIADTNEALFSLLNRIQSSTSQASVVDKARSMEETSRNLKTFAKMASIDVDLLHKQYEYKQKYFKTLEDRLQQVVANVSSIFTQLASINQTSDELNTANEAVKRYVNLTQIPDAVYDNIFLIQDSIMGELRPKLIKVQNYGEVGSRPDDEIKIKEAEESSHKLISQLYSTRRSFTERTKYYEKLNSSIGDQLSALRNKIERTRHLANGIQLSMSSKSDQELCIRSYQSKYLKPCITNYISMTYAIASSHRDALLFYLENSISGDFLAIEMINRKIRFVWDLGGGSAEIMHHLHIQTAGDLQKDQHWYKIDVERIGNVGKLSVRPVVVPSGSILTYGMPVTNASKPGWNRFDITNNDYIWIGGTNKPTNLALPSRQNGLVGSLYRVSFDKRPIGLWNFKAESEGNCVASVEGAEEIREDDSYFFTGDGYAILQGHSSSVYNKYFFSIAFNFKTFDENSLLFYAVAAKPHQYIAIVMKEGRIVFRIGYTEDIELEIKSSNRYTTGNWTRLEAARYYDRKKKTEKGILKIGSEVKEGVPSSVPAQSDFPDLSQPRYVFGGVPSGFETSITLPQSFLGCMSDLQVIQEAYNPLRGHFWGVQTSCSDKPITIVGFKGNGYLELPSHPLKKLSSFSFVFSTHQPDAFLMLSTTEGFDVFEEADESNKNNDLRHKVNFYSVGVQDGHVEVIVNAGHGNTRLVSKADTNYNDGQLHSLTLLKNGKRLELRVDDIIQAIGFMEEEGSGTVHAVGEKGGLFFGGLSSDYTLNASVVAQMPLIGTIQDAIFNDKLVYFDRPIEFEGALIGRSDSQSTSTSEMDILAQNTENGEGSHSCHKSYVYSVEPYAVQFGNQPYSYVRLDYNRQPFHSRNSTIELRFRTFYSEGILLIIPTANEEHNHNLRVFLHAGKVNVHVKGKKLHYEMKYDDGDWHRIEMTRDGRTLALKADDLPIKKKLMIPKKLNVKNSIYFGGYHQHDIQENSYSKLETLKGCIKEVIVNGKTEDLVGERAIHHRVGQCYPRIEKGAYFSGDAFSVVANHHYVERAFNVEFEFRTSELNGILMSISEPQGYPALSLELNRGKIILNGDMGDRRPFKIEHEFSSVFYFCDNEWHRVKVAFQDEEITLFVDDQRKMYWLSDNGHMTEAQINNTFYIGGVSENAPFGTLISKENFKGCIRNVAVDDHQFEWTQFHHLHNVFLTSCPIQ